MVFKESPDNILYSRPLTNISIAIDYQIWGVRPFGYHLGNTLLHIANSILLYLIVIRLGWSSRLALFSCLLFSLHPVNSEALAMIALGRAYLLSTLFSLLSWLFYLRWHLDSNQKKGISMIGFISCWFLAVTANELGFILPLFILAIGLFRSNKKDPINLLIIAAFIPILILLIIAPIKGVLGPLFNLKGIENLTIIPYLMSRYIKLLILPLGLSGWYEGMPIPRWPDLEVIFSIGVIGIIIGSMPILNRYDKRSVLPLGLILYTLFIVSLRAINNPPSLIGERWIYLGSIGFCLFLALVIEKIWETVKAKGNKILRVSLTALFLGIITSYGILVFLRNQDWKNEYTFWTSTVRNAPNSARALYNLGYAAHKRGYIDQAEEEYKEAIRITPLLEEAHNNLGFLYMGRDKKEDAIKEFKKVIEINPKSYEAHNNLGVIYSDMAIRDLAEEEFKNAIMIDPQKVGAHYNLGILYKERGLFDEAISELKKTLQIDPGFKEALKDLEEIYQTVKGNRR